MKIYLAFLMMFIIACAPVNPNAAEPDEVPDAPDLEPVVVPEPEPVVEVREVNPDVVKLWNRVDSLQGYSFTLAVLPEITGEDTYGVLDNMVIIDPILPIDMGDWSSDFILLDYDKKTATAYCVDLGGCYQDNRMKTLKFDEYAIMLPTEWFDRIQYGEIVGQQQFNERRVQVVRWQEDDLYYEAFVDDFYGLPQRVSVATNAEMTDIIGGGVYQDLETNSVRAEDVEAPY